MAREILTLDRRSIDKLKQVIRTVQPRPSRGRHTRRWSGAGATPSTVNALSSLAIVVTEVPASVFDSYSGILFDEPGEVVLLDECLAVTDTAPIEVMGLADVTIPVDTFVVLSSSQTITPGTNWPYECDAELEENQARVYARFLRVIDELYARLGAGAQTVLGIPPASCEVGPITAEDIRWISGSECEEGS